MSNKSEVLNFIKDIETVQWRPPDFGLGAYTYIRLPSLEDTKLAKYNVHKYVGEKVVVERNIADEDDFDEDELVNAVAVKAAIRLDENEEDEDNDETLTAEQLELCEWEKSKIGTGKWLTKLTCPSELYRFIIGQKGASKQQFEKKFQGIMMTVDEKGSCSGDVGGHSRIKLAQRVGQIELRHETSRKILVNGRAELEERILSLYPKLPYTHFVSIPFLIKDNTEVLERFSRFQKQVLKLCDPIKHKVDASLFQLNGQLHITLCMLRLYQPRELEAAKEVLHSLVQNSRLRILFSDDVPDDAKGLELPPRGFHIHLRGLAVMQESPSETSVLYTQEYSGRPLTPQNQMTATGGWLSLRRSAASYIHTLMEEMTDAFCSAGLLDAEEMDRQRMLDSSGLNLDVKLHVTLMNDKYRDTSSPIVRGMPIQTRLPFDASPILKEFSNFDFGVAVATGLHLSRRGKPATDTTYYEAECVVPLRPNMGL